MLPPIWREAGVFTYTLPLTECGLRGDYAFDWHTIAGGGGTSTGGVYSVSGTVGQHDAGVQMTLTGVVAAGVSPAVKVVRPADRKELLRLSPHPDPAAIFAIPCFDSHTGCA